MRLGVDIKTLPPVSSRFDQLRRKQRVYFGKKYGGVAESQLNPQLVNLVKRNNALQRHKQKQHGRNGLEAWSRHRQFMPYAEYLKTKYWRRVRFAVKRREGYACQWCRSTKDLQVHHTHYEFRGNELHGDNLKSLLLLCRTCHEGAHEIGDAAEGKHLPMTREYHEIVSHG